MNKLLTLKVMAELVKIELKIFKQNFTDKIIDAGIWVTLTIIVNSYIMPYFGLASNFGPFQFGSILAAIGLFELYGTIVGLVSDIDGDKIINYNFTLPIKSYLAIVSKSISYFILYLALSIAIFPLGKICLWNQIDLLSINYFKLILGLIVTNIFYASFVIVISSITKNINSIGSIWARFIFPIWFMGGFSFSWISLYKQIPTLVYLNLLNPMTYITELIRASLLGQDGYLNYWLCCFIIIIFSIFSLYFGVLNLKKKLDFI